MTGRSARDPLRGARPRTTDRAWKDGTLAGAAFGFIVWVSVITVLISGIAGNS